jgi:hypothetical protein
VRSRGRRTSNHERFWIRQSVVESPNLLADINASDEAAMKKILEDEATDVDLLLLRYFAASGLAFHSLSR